MDSNVKNNILTLLLSHYVEKHVHIGNTTFLNHKIDIQNFMLNCTNL